MSSNVGLGLQWGLTADMPLVGVPRTLGCGLSSNLRSGWYSRSSCLGLGFNARRRFYAAATVMSITISCWLRSCFIRFTSKRILTLYAQSARLFRWRLIEMGQVSFHALSCGKLELALILFSYIFCCPSSWSIIYLILFYGQSLGSDLS